MRIFVFLLYTTPENICLWKFVSTKCTHLRCTNRFFSFQKVILHSKLEAAVSISSGGPARKCGTDTICRRRAGRIDEVRYRAVGVM
jgi:hypothetical protein